MKRLVLLMMLIASQVWGARMYARIVLLFFLVPTILYAETWYVDPGNTHGAVTVRNGGIR